MQYNLIGINSAEDANNQFHTMILIVKAKTNKYEAKTIKYRYTLYSESEGT